jgi:hypothetical protein
MEKGKEWRKEKEEKFMLLDQKVEGIKGLFFPKADRLHAEH